MIITKELESGLAVRSDNPDRRKAELEIENEFNPFRKLNPKALVVMQRVNSKGIPYILLYGDLRTEYLKYKKINDKAEYLVNKIEREWTK